MKIKRFVAADMRTAFAMVREEQGPDAVILSNRVIDEGIEIVAASNYDESLVQRALEATRPAIPAAAVIDTQVASGKLEPARPPSPAEAAAAYFSRVTAASPIAAAAVPVTPAAAADLDAAARSHGHDDNRHQHPLPSRSQPAVGQRQTSSKRTLPPAWVQTAQAQPPVQALPPSFAAMFAASLAAPMTTHDVNAPTVDHSPAINTAAEDLPATHIAMDAPATGDRSSTITPPALSAVASSSEPRHESDAQLVQMRSELAAMREMIEREMHRLTDERLRGSPVRAQALELMEDYGFDAGISRDVALQIPADTEPHRGRGLMLGLLSRKLPITALDPLASAGVIALVGPTGAGKTTTIAKLAASYAALHNPRDVALITTDTLRVGGREQLHGHGRQLGIAVHEADSDTQLAQLLERLRDYKLVLIDTAGMGQRDRNLVGQLNWLRSAGKVHTLLVLPANSHFSDLDEVVRRFRGADPQGVVLTKLDETGRLGSALSVVVDHQLPLAWVTDGQRVPEDLHRANSAQLVLRLDQLRREADQPCSTEATHAA